MPIILDGEVAIQESDFIKDTFPKHGDVSVATNTNFIITFAVTVNANSLIPSNFRLEKTDSGERVEFNEINLPLDYSSLTKILTLKLDTAMDPNESYTLAIENLYNAAGGEMDQPHIITFDTSTVGSVVPEEVDTENLIIAEDRSLVRNDIVTDVVIVVDPDVEPDDVYFVTSKPTNLSYNITDAKINNIIDISFNIRPEELIQDFYKEHFKFEQKLIAMSETDWEDFPEEWHVIVDLDGIHIYDTVLDLQDGYEYRITVSKELPFLKVADEVFLLEDYVLQFMSFLPNMFTSVNSVLMYYPTLEPYDVAKNIYINSKMLELMNPNVTDTNINAINYVKFSTLYYFSTFSGGSSGSRIVLGDLEVENSSGVDNSLGNRWYDLMKQAELGLGRLSSRAFAVKGENWPSAHAPRNWD